MSPLPPPDPAAVRAARERIRGHAIVTPLLEFPFLNERTGGRILIKPECLQVTGSFKFRGAFNRLSMIPQGERSRGVVACSSGNHAQGVAEAARLLGMAATIVMPADAPALKMERTARSGATIVRYDREKEDREAIAREIETRTGATFVHPYDDPGVIAGQGTIGLEIAEQAAAMGLAPEAVLVCCSGGGLTAGTALGLEETLPRAMIHPVEPEGFDDYTRSLEAGERLSNTAVGGSVCDALMAPSPGEINFAINLRRGARGLTVSDKEALDAVAFAFQELKLVVEPGGAVALAAALCGRVETRGRTIAVVLSGGNIDTAMLARALG
ncbi:L-threonine ammonia-lyase [Breoghania corrubedonensis]|uniref:L-threonine ammonia-lyase n=1 Tax=Breoghania corrubedonensis TaxID=665038 RepID=A0A2T5V4P7_9HYPH|nr:threonine/serine dehydratase [Breoghania corrubedonensis]PTW58719.1 L-threonine ammonia-lyase [Breoghania corrubedonensis]